MILNGKLTRLISNTTILENKFQSLRKTLVDYPEIEPAKSRTEET